jgi:hypothetical protein
MNKAVRPVKKQPIQQASIVVRDFSLGEAVPYFAPAIDAQIDRHDASDDFVKEQLHTRLVGVRASKVQWLL